MQILIAVILKVIQMLLPALLDKMQDTAEEGSDRDVERWQDSIRDGGWTDEAIRETEPV
jgi:hypothetical protein